MGNFREVLPGFQFFQIFIIYAQRELHIWTPPLNSALKITLVWKFWAAEVVEAKECPAILVCKANLLAFLKKLKYFELQTLLQIKIYKCSVENIYLNSVLYYHYTYKVMPLIMKVIRIWKQNFLAFIAPSINICICSYEYNYTMIMYVVWIEYLT